MVDFLSDQVFVQTFADHTSVQVGNRSMEVERRDSPVRENVCPMEYVSIGLGSCIALTIAAVAAEKNITPEKIEVRVFRKTITRGNWQSIFDIQVDLGNGLTSRERILLFNAARSCEVHKMLNGDKIFNFLLNDHSSSKKEI
jgi:uncharacterized OsmC-like protein